MAIGAKKKKRIMSSEELSSFCDQIALMLSSGMTLRDGIEMLAEDEMKGNDGGNKAHPYSKLYKVVDETGSLYVAMKENEEDWPSYMIEMVDIGEQTGRLEDIMHSLSTYYQREGRIRSAAVSARDVSGSAGSGAAASFSSRTASASAGVSCPGQ